MTSWVKDFVVNTPFGNVLNTELNRRRTAQAQRDQIAGNIAQGVGIKQGQALLETDPKLVQRQIDADLQRIQSQIDNKELYDTQAEIKGRQAGLTQAQSSLIQAQNKLQNRDVFLSLASLEGEAAANQEIAKLQGMDKPELYKLKSKLEIEKLRLKTEAETDPIVLENRT